MTQEKRPLRQAAALMRFFSKLNLIINFRFNLNVILGNDQVTSHRRLAAH